ncbi:MAG: YicC family protein [Ignavibacteria bacterium]|nr:YicC family protein [Ignavibacteria bacterium]
MIHSMTGYGKAVTTIKDTTFEIEVRSLNSRFLEISLKIPSALQANEYEFRELIRKKVKRGKLYVTVSMTENGQNATSFVYNKEKIAWVVQTLKAVKKEFKIKDDLQLSHLLGIRDLFASDSDTLASDDFEHIRAAMEQALDNLQEMKRSEGDTLQKDLLKRIDFIFENLTKIEQEYQKNLTDYMDRYRQRVKELVENVTQYNDRMELEIALLTERSDITEECVRLHSHLKFFRETLGQEDAGRKLNFLCQELNREANTIGSKAITSEISHVSLQIKEEVERIREQVQNVE